MATATRTTITTRATQSQPTRSTASSELDRLAVIAKREHQAIIKLQGEALDHAIEAGMALFQIRSLLQAKRESWAGWVRENLQTSKVTADTSIRISQSQEKLIEMLTSGKAEPDGTLKPVTMGEGDKGSKVLICDPAALVAACKAAGIKAGIREGDIIDVVNVILDMVAAKVSLATEEDKAEMKEASEDDSE